MAQLVRLHPQPTGLIDAFRALVPAGKQDDDITVIALRRDHSPEKNTATNINGPAKQSPATPSCANFE